MTITWNPTDIPLVNADQLRLAMQILVDNGRGLALITGLTAYDRSRLEETFWSRFEGTASEGHAVLIRLNELIRVFTSHRLKDAFLEGGYAVIWQATSVAASMRLNSEWGFNPQKFLWSLRQLQNIEKARPTMLKPLAQTYRPAASSKLDLVA